MIRRNFLRSIGKAALLVALGAVRLVGRAGPRRFTWAQPCRKYPGPLRAPDEILKQSRWGG